MNNKIVLYCQDKYLKDTIVELMLDHLDILDEEDRKNKIELISPENLTLPPTPALIIFHLGGLDNESNRSEDFLKILTKFDNCENGAGDIKKLPPIVLLSTEEHIETDCFEYLHYFKNIYKELFGEKIFWFSLSIADGESSINKLLDEVKNIIDNSPGDFPNYLCHFDLILRQLNKKIEDKNKELEKLEKPKWKNIDRGDFFVKIEQYRRDQEFMNCSERWQKRVEFAHGGKERELLILEYANLAMSNIRYLKSKSMTQEGLKLLFVENKPDELSEDLKLLGKCFGWEFYCIKSSFWRLFENLGNKENQNNIEYCKFYYQQGWVLMDGKISFENFDLVLIDLFLGEENGRRWWGEDFLHLIYNKFPHIPIFILSQIEDYEIIKRTLQAGADYFIPKRQTIKIPHCFFHYQDSLGQLLSLFKDEDEEKKWKKNLVGNIRYWKIKKDLLWFGDKCYHMVDHSFDHTQNDWDLANQLLYEILKNKTDLMTREELYCLIMAIWLHDIGHKGNSRYGEPHQIRDNHGIISGELILQNPKLFRIDGYEDNQKSGYEEDLEKMQVENEKKTILQIIQDKIKVDNREPNILEKIALICIYHKSNSPLSVEDWGLLKKKGKKIPIDFFAQADRDTDPITLADIAYKNKNILHIVALFRFIDGLDINKNRVGDFYEKTLKEGVIKNDVHFQVNEKIRDEQKRLERIIDGTLRLKTDEVENFKKLFYEEIKEKIQKKKEKVEISKQREFINRFMDLENYYLLLNYAEFLSVQSGHFALHSSIDKIRILSNKNNPQKIEFHYLSNQKEEFLINANNDGSNLVREYVEKEAKTIARHLIGWEEKPRWENGYVLNELNSGKEFLQKWFDLQKIGLWCRVDGELKLVKRGGVKYNPTDKVWEHWEYERTFESYEEESKR